MAGGNPGPSGFDAAAGAAGRASMRKRLFIALGGAVVLAVLCYGVWYLLFGSGYVATDNAYVGGDIAAVTPLVAGAVTAVEVTDTQPVKRGQILVRLSDEDASAAVQGAQAEVGQAERLFSRTVATGEGLRAAVAARDADIASAQAQSIAAQAALRKARVDFDRRTALAKSGAVSGEEITSATNALAAANADHALARARIVQALANQRTAIGDLAASLALTRHATVANNPEVAAALARLRVAQLNLARTVIRAPLDGIVTQRQVQVGQRVAPGALLMTLVPIDHLYVDANFKESQLARVRVGQRVHLTSMLYGGDVAYDGTVVGLSGGTGAAFALIPAQNATGNWIRVTQRLPVRIALNPKQLRDHPLRIGLSISAEIRVDR